MYKFLAVRILKGFLKIEDVPAGARKAVQAELDKLNGTDEAD